MFRLILIRLLESYFRHRWLYFLPIVLMVGVAAAYILLQTPLYLTGGILHVQTDNLINTLTLGSNSNFSWTTPAEQKTREIGDLLNTDAFVRAIVSQTDLESEMSGGPNAIAKVLDDVRNAVWVTPAGDNQLLVAASYEDPNITYQLVTALVDTYVTWQINVELTESANAQKFFTDLAQEYKSDLEIARQEFDNYLLTHSEPERGTRPQIEQIQISRLEGEVNLASDRYASSIEKEELARLAIIQAESTIQQSYFLIDAPKIPTSAEVSKKSLVVTATIFVMIGVIISGVAIVGNALLDRSFRVPLDINQILNLPVLAAVPDVGKALAEDQTDEVGEKETFSDTEGNDKKKGKLTEPQPIS